MINFTVKEELASDIWDEIQPLLNKHWQEIGHYKSIPLDPDKNVYLALEEKKMSRVYVARKEDGAMIGYAVYFINHHPHHQSSLQAVSDIVYIVPECRGGVGTLLIKSCNERLAAEGVEVIYYHVHAPHNFGPMLERMGYDLEDFVYSKHLKKEN